MKIQPLHEDFQLPVRSSELAGGYDLFMPQAGVVTPSQSHGFLTGLGFAAEVPEGYVALLLPRSGAGAKYGLALNNTCGVIDADYRGEWKACLRTHDKTTFSWGHGDRILQFLLVPVFNPELRIVSELTETGRGEGGFGSTG
ncbi:MAG TPA: dUTP diphosphatase [Acidimicrobiia bacterium]